MKVRRGPRGGNQNHGANGISRNPPVLSFEKCHYYLRIDDHDHLPYQVPNASDDPPLPQSAISVTEEVEASTSGSVEPPFFDVMSMDVGDMSEFWDRPSAVSVDKLDLGFLTFSIFLFTVNHSMVVR